MKLKSFVLTCLMAGAAFVAPAADAQTIERSLPLITLDDGVGGFNAHFGDNFAASDAGRSFTDIFTFNVAGTPFDAAASLTSSYLDTQLSKDLQISALSLYRYDPATGQALGNAIAGIDNTGIGQHPIDAWSLEGFNLQSGYYALRVDGQVLGTGGGAFGADFTISPVPEPQAWGMLLAGLGLLGAGALRHRTSAPLRVRGFLKA